MIFLGVCLVLLVMLQIRTGGDYSWEPSFEEISTDPLGSKLFVEWLRTQVDVSDEVNDGRLAETLNSIDTSTTIFFLTERFEPDEGSLSALLSYIREGGSAIIAARHLPDTLESEFEIVTRSVYGDGRMRDMADTSYRFEQSGVVVEKGFMWPRRAFAWSGDTAGVYNDDSTDYGPWEPMIIGTYGSMIMGRRPYGEGDVTLIRNPQLLTNYAMLYDGLSQYTVATVNHLRDKPLLLDQHYKPKKSNRQGLLFTVGEYPALRFAYTTAFVAAIAFVILGMRRRQRPIPTVAPPLNTSIEFATTIAQMYEVGDTNREIAARMADQVSRVIRRRTGLRLGVDPIRTDHVAQALGIPEETIKAIVAEINEIHAGTWDNSAESFRAFHQRIQPIIEKGLS